MTAYRTTGFQPVLVSHPTEEDVLGFKYPSQTSSRAETVELVEHTRDNPDAVLAEFHEHAERVRAEHSHTNRFRRLTEVLA